MVKSYEKQAKSKADIAKENREKNLERASGGGGIHAGKSKDKIAKEKSLITKQRIKEKEKASTQSEKKDLDATQKRESTHPIHKKKGQSIEIKQKPKVKIKPKSKKDIAQQKSKEALEREKKGIRVSTPEKHPAHRPKPKQKEKGLQAAEIGKGGKSPGPKERKKLPKKAVSKTDAREEARKPKKKEATKQAETGTRKTSYEARLKALMAKKDELSKKETADGRNEYQVRMNKLKKEDKKAWKKIIKG